MITISSIQLCKDYSIAGSAPVVSQKAPRSEFVPRLSLLHVYYNANHQQHLHYLIPDGGLTTRYGGCTKSTGFFFYNFFFFAWVCKVKFIVKAQCDKKKKKNTGNKN